MADVVLDATPNGTAANSYLTIVEATVLSGTIDFGERWDDLEEEDQKRRLLKGTRLIDQYPEGGWGPREEEDQRLVFPRAGDEPGVILEGVKRALMEYVDFRLAGDLDILKRLQAEGVTSTSMLGQSSSFEADESGLPAPARKELDRILEQTQPTFTKNLDETNTRKEFFS